MGAAEQNSGLEAVRQVLDAMDVEASLAEAEEPHSVIAYDPLTRSYSVNGPYPDGHTATVAAERIRDELNAAAGAPGYPEIQTWIAPHYPPSGDYS